MGYYLSLDRAKFAIPVARTEEAMRVLGPFHADIVIRADAGGKPTLAQIFQDLAWPLKRKNDQWVMVQGERCKQGWEQMLFEKAAPFVVDGSVIIAHGEDGAPFEWHFVKGEVFDEDPGLNLIGAVRLTVPAANLKAAIAHVQKKLPKLMAKLDEPSSVTAVFDRLGWQTQRGTDGTLQVVRKVGSDPKLTKRDERVLQAVAGFVAPDSIVEGIDAQWRIVFTDGRCERENSGE